MPIVMEIKATAVNPVFLRNARRPNFKSWSATESLCAGSGNHRDRCQVDSFGVRLPDEHPFDKHLLISMILGNEVRSDVAEVGELKSVFSGSRRFCRLHLIAGNHFRKSGANRLGG